MTETIEGNKLIAEFDGWQYSKSGKTVRKSNESSPYRLKDIHYHTSWDWLMPVIEKINQYYFDNYEKEKGNQATLRQLHGAIWIDLRRIDIKETHADVVQFITWYNTQSK